MRIVLISDTHALERQLPALPAGDVLIHAGDFTNVGQEEDVIAFDAWLAQQPFTHKILIGGNHDRGHDLLPSYFEALISPTVHYLKNSGVEVSGLKVWGSPYTPFFSSDYWRFHTTSDQQRREMWAQIPEGLDVLVTHGPPQFIGDRTLEGDYAGDRQLAQAVLAKQPKIHVFGHIHEGFGMQVNGETTFFNASQLDRLYKPTNLPWVIDYEAGQIVRINGEEQNYDKREVRSDGDSPREVA